MNFSPVFTIALGYFILFSFLSELLPDFIFFTPMILLFSRKMQKREVFLIFSLQFVEEFLLFVPKRELFFIVFDAISLTFGVSAHHVRVHYDLIVLFSFLFSISLSYLLSLGFVKVMKLNRRLDG